MPQRRQLLSVDRLLRVVVSELRFSQQTSPTLVSRSATPSAPGRCSMKRALLLTIAMTVFLAGAGPAMAAEVKPTLPAGIEAGTIITKANAAKVSNLVSPGNYVLVSQGMEMKIVPARDYNWPP